MLAWKKEEGWMMRPTRMMIRALVVPVMAAIFASMLWAVPAWAAPTLKVKPAIGPPTSKPRVTGTGFGALEVVDLTFDAGSVGSAHTNATGTFKTHVIVPQTATPGSHSVKATGEQSGLTATANFLVRTDWPQYHFDAAHQGSNPYENVLNASNVSGLTQKWVTSIGSANSAVGSPAVVGGVLYETAGTSAADAHLVALNATSGRTLWTSYVSTGLGWVSPAVGGGRVFAGYVQLFAWPVKCTSPPSCPTNWVVGMGSEIIQGITYSNGDLYVTTDQGNLHVYQASTGSLLWTGAATLKFNAPPSVANGLVYVSTSWGGTTNYMYVFNAAGCGSATCTPLWTAQLDAPGGNAAVVVTQGMALARATDYGGPLRVEAFAAGGCGAPACDPLWKTDVQGGYFTPAVSGANLILPEGPTQPPSSLGYLEGMSIGTGSILWTEWLPPGSPLPSAAVAANGVAYVTASDGRVYALDPATGATLWSASVGGSNSLLWEDPVVVNGMLYVATHDGTMYAFGL